MPAPVMWAKVLTGILASHFFLFSDFGVLTSVFAMLAPVKAGIFDEDTLEVQILFFWLWLGYYPLCNVSPSNVGSGFDGGTLEGQILFCGFGSLLLVACLLSSLQCQPQ